jgi:hypothetical protein
MWFSHGNKALLQEADVSGFLFKFLFENEF